MADLILGGDLGGSTTRIVLTDAGGAVRGRGTAAGGNPVSHPDTAHASFEAALRGALGDIDPGRVRGGVIGMAGSIVLRDPAARAEFDAVWSRCGLSGTPHVVSDLEVAYASAAEHGSGLVLIAGTGASAARIEGWELQERRGGYGWLLGDEGAGVWLGRAAVRATLGALYDGRSSALAERVLAHFGLDAAEAGALIQAVNNAGPLALAGLAPLVTQAHRDGSPDAMAIVDESARLLVETLSGLLPSVEEGPIVLAGSILAESLPMGQAVHELLVTECGARLRFAASGMQGALALATREFFRGGSAEVAPEPVAGTSHVARQLRDAVLAIDIGGTKTSVALFGREGIIGEAHGTSTPGRAGRDAIIAAVVDAAERAVASAEGVRVRAVGIGTAGVVDVSRGMIISSTDTLVDWAGTHLAGAVIDALQSVIGADVPIHVQNDVDAFGLGELRAGAAKSRRSAIVVAVGTGVGASMIIDGQVVRGSRSVAGEIGHSPIAHADHLQCPCGRFGHLEALGSGVGMHRHFLSLGGDASVVDARGVVSLAVAGDAIAVTAVEDSAAAVGRAIAAMVALVDPESVVISGGVVESGAIWWVPMERALRAELIDVQQRIPVLPGVLGGLAPLHGAASSAWELVTENDD